MNMTSKKTKKTSNIDDLFEILQGMDALDIPCQRLRTVKQLKAEIKDAFSHSLNGQNWKNLLGEEHLKECCIVVG